jgi:restriction endonuclease S subunit
MNAEQLLRFYSKFSDAPDSIRRLKRFILDLAVRGKLVKQDHEDQAFLDIPLDCINAPFEIPPTWRWKRIGDQLELLNGIAFKPTDWIQSGIPIVRIQNLNNLTAPFNYCDPSKARSRSLINNGSFLISWSGTPGTSFGAFIWNRGEAVLNQHIFRCDFKTEEYDVEFLRLAINGQLDEMIAKAHGGAGLQHITKGKLEDLLITLPPIAEQRRIVAKVDELMELCNKLEAAKDFEDRCRTEFTLSTLDSLTSREGVDYSHSTEFALNNIETLTHEVTQIKALKKLIIELAVQGKLVQKNLGDKSIFELLNENLIKEFTVNLNISNWATGAVGELLDFKYGKGLPENMRGEEGPISVFGSNGVICKTTKPLTHSPAIIVGRKGSAGALNLCAGPSWTTDVAYYVEAPPYFLLDYLYLTLSALNMEHLSKGVKPGLSRSDVYKLQINVPPLLEQDLIVKKVNLLIEFLEKIEASIDQSNKLKSELIDSALHHALN